MVGLVGELGGHEDLGHKDFFPNFGSDKRSKVSRNTLNEGSKSGKKSLRPKSSCPPNSPTKPTILPNKSPKN